jgi:L-ribulokinase
MFTIGLDFGANSGRALVVRCSDGAEYGSRVVDYPSGSQGVLLDPNNGHLARQFPGDYLFGLEESIRGALTQATARPNFSASQVVGIGVSTGSIACSTTASEA